MDCIDIADQALRAKVWEFLGVENCTYHFVSGDEEKAALMVKLLASGDVDLVYVDGDHSYDSARYDIDLCKGVKHILVHDYEKHHFPGVVKAVEETKGKKDIVNLFAMIEVPK